MGLEAWLLENGWVEDNIKYFYQDTLCGFVYTLGLIGYCYYMVKVFRKNKEMYNRYNMIICIFMILNIVLRIYSMIYFISKRNSTT